MLRALLLIFGIALLSCSSAESAATVSDRPATVPDGFSRAEHQRLTCFRWVPVDSDWRALDSDEAFWQFDIKPYG